jgi:hypothetical protein
VVRLWATASVLDRIPGDAKNGETEATAPGQLDKGCHDYFQSVSVPVSASCRRGHNRRHGALRVGTDYSGRAFKRYGLTVVTEAGRLRPRVFSDPPPFVR